MDIKGAIIVLMDKPTAKFLFKTSVEKHGLIKGTYEYYKIIFGIGQYGPREDCNEEE